MTGDQERDLRQQHKELIRTEVYDHHNRRPIQTPIRTIRNRRSRRWWRRVVREWGGGR